MKVLKVLSRFYVNDINHSIDFYEKILDVKCSNKFVYSAINLEIAQIGDVLIIGGSEEAIKPFRSTNATFLVDSIVEYKNYLLQNGATVIRDIREVPTGKNMTMQHSDGTIIEYVEHEMKKSEIL